MMHCAACNTLLRKEERKVSILVGDGPAMIYCEDCAVEHNMMRMPEWMFIQYELGARP